MTDKERYHYRKENNICTQCGKAQTEEGKTRCRECGEKENKYNMDKYYFLKNLGICTRCGKEKAYKGSTMCISCRINRREKDRQWYRNSEKIRKKVREDCKKRRERLKEQGLCVNCGKQKDRQGVLCDKCTKKQTIYKRIIRYKNSGMYRIERTSYGKCYVCGHSVSKESKKLCERCLENCRINLEKARNNPNFEMLKQRERWKRQNQLIYKVKD